jgi:FAD:protein FMN transferase
MMGKSVFFMVMAFLFLPAVKIVKKIQFEGAAQGTSYHITYYAEDSLVSQREVDSILDKIDSSLSLYKPYSLINSFNRSRQGIRVDNHFRIVTNKALDMYRQTNGLFDITIYPITAAWGFGPKKIGADPSGATIRALLPCVDSRLLYWKGSRLMKKKPCVQLDANGIAQGYSVDVLADFFEEKGIADYLVELGGEIRVKGRKRPSNEKMSIGIEAPGGDPDFSPIDRVVWMDSGAITTSGNYRRYHESKGKRVSHLMNPHTGYPLQNELISVTVYARDAITADAYDNALMAMGLRKALAFVEKRPAMAAHFIYHKKDGAVADTMSSRFRVLLQP